MSIRRAPRAAICILFLGASVQCSAQPGSPPAAPVVEAIQEVAAGPGLLFIGNSLTAANDLPGRVQELAGDADRPVQVSRLLVSGYSLEDHLAGGQVGNRIASRPWTLVVMQQGPSTLADSRVALVRDASILAEATKAAGGRPALLGVWPLPGQRQQDVTASYRAAAEATGSLFIPAGEAWAAARAADPSLVMTSSDGFHPSPLGTYLAALAVHCALHGALPASRSLAVERERSGTALSAAQAEILRRSACAPGGER